MSEPDNRSVVVAREYPHPPETVWRALTEPHLIQDWLMTTDFAPTVGRAFTFSADWGAVNGRVMEAEPCESLVYTWETKDLVSVVRWTLSRTPSGTHVTMEQTGFRPDQKPYFQGASVGWPRFLAALRSVLDRRA